MDKRVRILISIGILVILGTSFYFASYLITKYTGYTITGKIVYNKDEKIQIGKCLSDKAVLYCSSLSLNCLRQEKALGEAFNYVTYIDCNKNEECRNLNLPTWKIDNKMYYGIQELEKLAELAGCEADGGGK